MSERRHLQVYAFFAREGGSINRSTKPTSWNGYSLGTVRSMTWTNEPENDVFAKPIGGIWRDYSVIPVRNRQTFELTLDEITPEFWKLCMAANPTLSGGGANYEPGAVMATIGWLQLQFRDSSNVLENTVEVYCHIEITTQSFEAGTFAATLRGRVLDSALNSGTFSNLTF